MLFKQHQRILFIGDSITDADRSGMAAPYGNGYVSMVRSFMIARYPEYNLTFINRGIGGNTVRNLSARWERDVIAERPHWVSVMIGINDVWRHFAYNAQEAVPLDEFQSTLRRLLQRVRESIRANLILITPYMIESSRTDPMRQLMNLYGKTIELLAIEFNATLVNTQNTFDEVLRVTPASYWASDRIHPGGAGHALLALAFLRAVGFEL